MIDVVQRLGIDYYFQDEIELILRRQYSIFFTDGDRYNDLQEVALRFRLLRQQGYYVSPGLCICACVFNFLPTLCHMSTLIDQTELN